MNNKVETVPNQLPNWIRHLLPLFSAIVGGLAIWFSWLKYTNLSQTEFNWYDYWYVWIRPGAIGLIGILCLVATVLFMFKKTSGLVVFKSGLTILPIILIINLVIFVMRGIENLFNGNATAIIDRITANPQKFISIPIIILILIGFDIINKKQKKQ